MSTKVIYIGNAKIKEWFSYQSNKFTTINNDMKLHNK